MAQMPGPPGWRPINASNEEVYRGANLAIEDAYKTAKSNQQGYLVGSDFDRNPYLQLPRGAPNKRFGNVLLGELKGLVRPRQPDIVDFVDRTFFEIKPVGTFRKSPTKTVEQLASLYATTEAIRVQFGPTEEPAWHSDNVLWIPPDVLPMPGDPNQLVVTTYTKVAYATYMKGLIIYEVWEASQRKKKKTAVKSATITDQNSLFSTVLPKEIDIAKAIGEYDEDEPDYVIIAPRMLGKILDFDRRFDRMYGAGVPPMFDRRQPRSQLRDILRLGPAVAFTKDIVAAAPLVAIALGINGLLLITTLGIIVAPEVAAAAVGGSEAGGGGAVISLAARRLAMEAAKAAPELGKAALKEGPKIAAGVLLVVGTVAKARPNQVEFSNIDMIRAVPASRVTAYKGTLSSLSSGMAICDPAGTFPTVAKPIEVGDTVMFDSQPNEIIAKVTVC